MPILHAEPQLFPEHLLDADSASPGGWWVMYTLARREKLLCRQLLLREIPFYAPMRPRPYRSPAGRSRMSHLPLFANYVFVCGDEMQRYQAVSTGYVSQCLKVHDADRLCDDLRQIQRLLNLGTPLTPEEQLSAGMRVRVKQGPMQGLEGTVLQRRNQRLLLVAVNFIQRGASIELGDWELEAVE